MNTRTRTGQGREAAFQRHAAYGAQSRKVNGAKQFLMGFAVMVVTMVPCRMLADSPDPVGLGTAGGFAVLAGAGITVAGAINTSTITGDIGTFPTLSISGLGNVVLSGVNHGGDAVTQSGKTALVTAYNDAAGRAATKTYPPIFDLGGLTLTNGVYNNPSSFGLTGTLTLDAQGNPDAVWIFQAGSTVIAEAYSQVVLVNGAQACHVYWQVGSSATLRTGAIFKGDILAFEAITLETGATLDGRALARTAEVTLDTSSITLTECSTLNLTLTIISEHGTGTPLAGLPPEGFVYTNAYGATLTNSITAVEVNGGTQYVNVGWAMIGNEPLQGLTHSMVMVQTNDAVLTWLWTTNYALSITAAHGAVTNETEGWKPAGSDYELHPVPETGYVLDYWIVNGVIISNSVPLTGTMDGATDVIVVFRPTFIDVSSQVDWYIDWVCDTCTGYYIGTLTIANSNAVKSLTAPIWFEVQSTPQYWLRRPTGFDTNTSMSYLDISTAVGARLLTTGDGDLALDPGESVTITGIELIGDYAPDGLVMAVWADPPEAVVADYRVSGVAFEMSLPEPFVTAPKAKVKGLPAGLTFNAATRKITGVPINPGAFELEFSATGVPTQKVMIWIGMLPAWAQGTFNGYIEGGGVASMTVSPRGKITGKLTSGGVNYTFSAAAYSAGGNAAEGFVINTVAKSGRTVLPLTLLVTEADAPALPVSSAAVGHVGGVEVALYRDVWKTAGSVLAPYIGYYTATLPGDAEHGSGYLTFTVSKGGKVKMAGKLADGTTALSLASTLISDGTGRVFAVVYTVPSAYKGGSFFGLAEFVKPVMDAVYLRPLDAMPFLWENRDPKATGVFGAGFERTSGLVGGWYSKTADLGDYYAGGDLSMGTDTNAPVPELTVGVDRFGAVAWDPDGLVLHEIYSPSGDLVGLTAPAAGVPVKVGGVWDYGAENTVAMKFSLARPTGLFKGSFKAWFDYDATHTSRNIEFQGVLTPEREDKGDLVAGRGFFLWADKAQYLNPQNKLVPYSYKWSYDLKIQLPGPTM